MTPEGPPRPQSAWRTPPSGPAPFRQLCPLGQLSPRPLPSCRPGPEQRCRLSFEAPDLPLPGGLAVSGSPHPSEPPAPLRRHRSGCFAVSWSHMAEATGRRAGQARGHALVCLLTGLPGRLRDTPQSACPLTGTPWEATPRPLRAQHRHGLQPQVLIQAFLRFQEPGTPGCKQHQGHVGMRADLRCSAVGISAGPGAHATARSHSRPRAGSRRPAVVEALLGVELGWRAACGLPACSLRRKASVEVTIHPPLRTAPWVQGGNFAEARVGEERAAMSCRRPISLGSGGGGRCVAPCEDEGTAPEVQAMSPVSSEMPPLCLTAA